MTTALQYHKRMARPGLPLSIPNNNQPASLRIAFAAEASSNLFYSREAFTYGEYVPRNNK